MKIFNSEDLQFDLITDHIIEEIDSPHKFDVIPNKSVDESKFQQNCMLFNYFKTRIIDLKNNKI